MNVKRIIVPDILGGYPSRAEPFFACLHKSPAGKLAILDLAGVSWIRPYGVVALFEGCRFLHHHSHMRVCLTGLQIPVHAYLRRIDFFKYGKDVFYTDESFSLANEMNRNSFSPNILEIFPISASRDIYDITARVQCILTDFLEKAHDDIGYIVTLISEACSNVVDHSHDAGIITIQKYKHNGITQVILGIGDMGQGIRQSLMAVHGSIAPTCAAYIQRAIGGLTARPNERGGLGLGSIQNIAVKSGGSLYIRSETGSVQVSPSGAIVRENLHFFPGTQISITFRGRRWN